MSSSASAEKTAVGQNDEILDLGAAEPDPIEHVESSNVVASPLGDLVSDEPVRDEPFDVASVETPVSSPILESYTDVTPSFLEGAIDEETPKSSSKGLAIGVAAAAVVIAIIVGFFVFSSKSSAPSAQTPTAAAAVSDVPAAAPPAAEPPAQAQVDSEQPADQTSSAPAAVEPGSHEKNTRAAVTPAQDKTKKPAKPAPTKKQVTVDDLINDN